MVGRRILYSLVLVGCFIFYLAYQEWLAWLLFVVLFVLPLFSLLVSLPAMLTTRLRLTLPPAVEKGTSLDLRISYRCPLPTPMLNCRLIAERPMTGQRWKLKESAPLPTEHCGTLTISVKRARILDYMGLTKLPVRFTPRHHQVCVRPVPIPVEDLPPLERCTALRWKPKPGGGFSENHELRLYRPGDNIQQIHWKLSAKIGNLILREPMEPVRNRVLLRMDLTGTPEILDRKLGQLLWIGQHLLENGISFQLQCLTALGAEEWSVESPSDFDWTLEQLLGRSQPPSGSLMTRYEPAGWQYFIGGGDHEA